jgi:hypothetical protein
MEQLPQIEPKGVPKCLYPMEWPNAAWLKWFEYRTELPRSLINPILFTQSNLNSRLRPSQDKIIWDFKERDSS